MLIGKRFIDFIIVGGIVFGISFGIWRIGDNMVNKQCENVKYFENEIRLAEESHKKFLEISYHNWNMIVNVDAFNKAVNSRLELLRLLRNYLYDAQDAAQRAGKLNHLFSVLSILVAFLGAISTIGIVFRPKELSQKDAFIATWTQYVKGYFKSDKKNL